MSYKVDPALVDFDFFDEFCGENNKTCMGIT
jgi:hypothetical protein